MGKPSVQIVVLGARDLPDPTVRFTVQTVITKCGANILGTNRCILTAYYMPYVLACRWECV